MDIIWNVGFVTFGKEQWGVEVADMIVLKLTLSDLIDLNDRCAKKGYSIIIQNVSIKTVLL